MIVQPGLPDDPKYLRFKRALKSFDPALQPLEVLVRLWGHCQQNCRGEFWPGAEAEDVADVLRYDGDAQGLLAVLIDRRWVDREDNGLRIHGWDQNNHALVSAWKNGRTGGRKPAKKTTDRLTGAEPDNNRPVNPPTTDRLTGAEPTGKPVGEPINKRDRIEGGNDEKQRSASPTNRSADPDFPEAQWPTLEEVLACGRQLAPTAPWLPELCRKFHRYYEGTIPKWTIKGRAFRWQMKLEDWVTEEARKPGKKNAGSAGGAEAREIEAELQWQKEAGRCEQLRRRLKEISNA